MIDDHNADTAEYEILRNVFAHCEYGLYSVIQTGYPDTDINGNGFHNCTTRYEGPLQHGPEIIENRDPFDPNANGSYYLKRYASTQNAFIDAGGITPAAAGLTTRTTTAATLGNDRVKREDIGQSETWTPFAAALEGSSQVDLGYHYDPVDYIVDPEIKTPYDAVGHLDVYGAGTTLWINPGVVVAFSAETLNPWTGQYVSHWSMILAREDGSINAQGNGDQPITFTSTASSGDRIGHRENDGTFGWYSTAIYLHTSDNEAGPNTRIRYCNFSWAQIAVAVDCWLHDPPLDINNCRFSYCMYGLLAVPRNGKTVRARNDLFHDLSADGMIVSEMGGGKPFVENCTFARMSRGIYATAATTIINCIFHECGQAIATPSTNPPTLTVSSCYGDGAGEDDPRFDAGNPPVPLISERFYLQQEDSPCIDAGDPTVEAYQSTARDKRLDYGGQSYGRAVDIGYHYPVKGYLKVSPNGRYFENEDGTPFVPIGTNEFIGITFYKYSEEKYHVYPWGYPTYVQPLRAYFHYLRSMNVNFIRLFLEHESAWGCGSGWTYRPPWFFEEEIVDGSLDYSQIDVRDEVKLFWSNIFSIAEESGIRVLLSPWDPYWMAHGNHINLTYEPYGTHGEWTFLPHPYYRELRDDGSGYGDYVLDRCGKELYNISDYLNWRTDPTVSALQLRRFEFCVRANEAAWGVGRSPSLVWEIMNETNVAWYHPLMYLTGDQVDAWTKRALFGSDGLPGGGPADPKGLWDIEMETWGRHHLLSHSSSEIPSSGAAREWMYGNQPYIQFSQMHNYAVGNDVLWYTENDLWNCAKKMAELVKSHLEAIAQYGDPLRPYLDAEWGPATKASQANPWGNIEKSWYFHHAYDSAYSHAASGGAGTGLHWAYRDDQGESYGAGMISFEGQDWYFAGHLVTAGVRAFYCLLAEFLEHSAINFANFPQHQMTVGTDQELELAQPNDFFVTGCTDGRQALVFLLRKRPYTDYADFDLVTPVQETLTVRGLYVGKYVVDVWEGWNNDVLAYDTALTPSQLPSLNPNDFLVERRHVNVAGSALSLANLTMRKGLLLTIGPE